MTIADSIQTKQTASNRKVVSIVKLFDTLQFLWHERRVLETQALAHIHILHYITALHHITDSQYITAFHHITTIHYITAFHYITDSQYNSFPLYNN